MNLRVDEKLKKNAEKITKELGIPMSVAVTLFLKALVREKALPFLVSVDPKKKRDSGRAFYDDSEERDAAEENVIDQDAVKNAIDKL